MSPREPIAAVGAVQALIVVSGTLTVTLVVKANGYGIDPLSRWNSRALWIREQGWLLLLIPVVWTILAAVAARQPSWGGRMIICGAVLVLALVFFFGEAAFRPCTKAILM